MYDDVSIIFPALNEKERILPTLKDYILTLGPSVEYIVVDNGSTDGTQEAVLAKFPHVIYVRNEFPLGKGGAVYAGFDVAKGLIVGFTDPDGATSAKEFIKLLNKAKTSDVVIGSRWLPGSKISPQQPFIRQINSRAFNLAIKTLLPLSLSDTQCGA
ncbi:glycosyl transferase, partial [candidate division WWE3 bacterium CG_4_9_14_3_um_filter_39_7]